MRWSLACCTKGSIISEFHFSGLPLASNYKIRMSMDEIRLIEAGMLRKRFLLLPGIFPLYP